MATLQDLFRMGVLLRYEPDLDPYDQELRLVCIYPAAADWLDGPGPAITSPFGSHMTPKEQAAERLDSFCAGYEIEIPKQMRCLRHVDSGIWELKTLDIRLFGWFVRRDVFVVAVATLADEVKQNDLYDKMRGIVISMRDNLDLDEPKFIPGDQVNDVISDCN